MWQLVRRVASYAGRGGRGGSGATAAARGRQRLFAATSTMPGNRHYRAATMNTAVATIADTSARLLVASSWCTTSASSCARTGRRRILPDAASSAGVRNRGLHCSSRSFRPAAFLQNSSPYHGCSSAALGRSFFTTTTTSSSPWFSSVTGAAPASTTEQVADGDGTEQDAAAATTRSGSSASSKLFYTPTQKEVMGKCKELHASIMPLNERVGKVNWMLLKLERLDCLNRCILYR